MIERIAGFKVGDHSFATLQDAQKHALEQIFNSASMGTDTEQAAAVSNAADAVLTHRDKVIDILTTTKTTRARARKTNGGKRVRATSPAPAIGSTASA